MSVFYLMMCLESMFHESTAKSRPPTTFVFSYAVIKNCIITVLWLLPWHLFSWRFGLPSAYFLLNHAPGGMSLLIYMHSFSCIILLHLAVVFCIGILLGLCVRSGFSCTCHSPVKYLWFEPFFGFADILAIRVVFTQTSCWFSQYPYPSPISMWIYHHYDNYWWNTSPANLHQLCVGWRNFSPLS